MNEFRVRGVANRLWSAETAALSHEERDSERLRSGIARTALAMCVPAYLLGSWLVAMGLGRGQALAAIALASALSGAGMMLQARTGEKFGVPFGVAARASFGVLGARVPVALRALVGCGWFGMQCWLGGLLLLSAVRWAMPEITAGAVWGCFTLFVLVSLGATQSNRLPGWRLCSLLLTGAGVVLLLSGVGGATVASPPLAGPSGLPRLFLFGVTAVMGLWGVTAVGSADLARHGQSEKETQTGLTLGVFMGMTVFAALGVICPRPALGMAIESTSTAWSVAGFIVLMSALLLGSSAGLRSVAKEIASLQPDAISLPLGSLLGAMVGVAWLPWRWMADPRHYVRGWLPGCAGVLWAICGVMLVDYFLLRRSWLNVEALYLRDGLYEYSNGVNGKALVALAAGIAASLGGRLAVPLHGLVAVAGFLGFTVAGLVYLVMMSGPPVRAVIPPAPLLIPVAEFEAEGASG